MVSAASSFFSSRSARDSSALMKELRDTLTDLQRQLATGKKAGTYGDLGASRQVSLDLHARLAAIDGYSGAIDKATLRLQLMNQSLAQIGKASSDMLAAARSGGYAPNASGRSVSQISADEQMKMVIDSLNIDQNGAYLFAGRSAEVKPVASFDEIMNGTGAKAGLKQIVAERKTADLGTGGLGRLAAPTIAGATVSLSRDGANPGPFGFAIASASSSLSNASVSGPAGALQSVAVNFTGQPQDGERIAFTLSLPDGTTKTLTLTAAAGGSSSDGTFAIGATAAGTAANFRAALEAAVRTTAETALAAASANAAAQNFFSASASAPPQRVPSPAAGATGLVAGAAADSVIWYRGDDAAAPAARATALVRVGDQQSVATGARASETGITRVMAALGALAAIDVAPSDPDAQARYEEIAARARTGLTATNDGNSVLGIQIELANASASVGAAKERLAATKSLLTDTLSAAEEADKQDVAAAILALQTRLEATYATTASLSKLSLVNYLG